MRYSKYLRAFGNMIYVCLSALAGDLAGNIAGLLLRGQIDPNDDAGKLGFSIGLYVGFLSLPF